uniref:Uncharacterized protein n=1 Tax=Eutreptiella gymnastica TaxID=73025 RepID=A0A7S1NED5_9EUGL
MYQREQLVASHQVAYFDTLVQDNAQSSSDLVRKTAVWVGVVAALGAVTVVLPMLSSVTPTNLAVRPTPRLGLSRVAQPVTQPLILKNFADREVGQRELQITMEGDDDPNFQVQREEYLHGEMELRLGSAAQVTPPQAAIESAELPSFVPSAIMASLALLILGMVYKWTRSIPMLGMVEDPVSQRQRLAMLGLTGHPKEPRRAFGKSTHTGSTALYGWLENNKDVSGRDKMWEEQQRILKERRSGNNSKIEAAKERRAKVKAFKAGTLPKEEMDAIKKRNKEKAQALSKEAMKGGIPLPMASFGMPEFDGGERFDLKGPYVDEGWVDEKDKDKQGCVIA